MNSFFQKIISVSGLTFLSRILGVVRDGLIAYVFGASFHSDAFFIAFRPFDLLRKMFSDGVLSISFVPGFSRYLALGRKDQAIAMFLSALFLLSVFSAVMVSVGIYFAPFIVGVIAPGFAGGTYVHTLTALLLKFMMPYLFMVLFIALSMGVLNSLGNYHIPAATPILLNVTIIVVTLFFSSFFQPRVLGLALGVTLGGLVQLVFQLPFLFRQGMMDFSGFTWCHPGVVRAGRILVPCMLGAASFQVNLLIAGFLASTLVPGSVSFLYYADRLVQFPLALFAVSFSTVFLPLLSGKNAMGHLDDLTPVFEKGVRLVLFITIPAMVGIMVLDTPIVSIIFGRGAFGPGAVEETASCLFFLAMGLWAATGTRLFVTLSYAVSDIRTPFWAGLLAIGVNLVLGLAFIGPMGVTGLALSVALASMAGFCFLAVYSSAGHGLTTMAVSACRALFLSGIMAVPVRLAAEVWISGQSSPLAQGMGLFACIGIGIVTFALGAVLTGSPEIEIFKEVFKRKI